MHDSHQEPSPPDGRHDGATLVGFRVRMFRTIRDSGFVPLFPVTALVGGATAGKTSLLDALAGSDPGRDVPYDIERDWPRGGRHLRDPDYVPCEVLYRFGRGLRSTLVDGGVLAPEDCGVRLGRSFAGRLMARAWDGAANGGALDNGSFEGSTELVERIREYLPPLLEAGRQALLPAAVAAEDLFLARPADEGSGVAALGRLLAAAGLTAGDLLGSRAVRRAREATEALAARMGRAGLDAGLIVEADRGRVQLLLAVGRVRVPLDRLPDHARYRLTLELRTAAALDGGGLRPVLLLDGPGRFFRGERRARMHAMHEALAAAGARVVYTSRLPFDVDLQHSEQVLALTPAPNGTAIAWHASDAGRDLVVRGVLGMVGRASFRIDELNLVVEGVTDAALIGALDRLFVRLGREALPPDLNVISAGGAREVATVSEFLARRGLGVLAMLDSDRAGDLACEELRQARLGDPRLHQVQVLQVAAAARLEPTTATIEDLFPPALYLAAARRACRPEDAAVLAAAIEGPASDDQSRVAQIGHRFHSAGLRFPKAAIARELEAALDGMRSAEELPDPLTESARSLFEAVRAAARRSLERLGPRRD